MSGKDWRYLTLLTYKTHFTVTYTTANLARTFKQEASCQHQIFFSFFLNISHVYWCNGIFYCLIVPVWKIYILWIQQHFPATHLQLASEFKFNMKYVPFWQSISSENFRPTDSELQSGLNDSKELQLALPGETCLDGTYLKKWKKMTQCPDNM